MRLKGTGISIEVLWLVSGLLFGSAVCALSSSTQGDRADPESVVASLDRWRAAVLAGDGEKLKALYSSDAKAVVKTPAGSSTEPSEEEPEFWSRLAASGLKQLTVKVLQRTSPQSGVVSLVLRVELTFQSQGKTRKALVSTAQLWANQEGEWRIFVTRRSDTAPLEVFRLPEPKTPNIHLYPESDEAHKDLDVALASATVDHKRVLLIFGANWCYDCHVLDAALRSSELAPLVAANYHIVHVNIGEGRSNVDLAKRFQVPLEKGVPGLAVIDSSGQLITSQKQGEFESAAQIGMSDVSDFLKRWKPGAAN